MQLVLTFSKLLKKSSKLQVHVLTGPRGSIQKCAICGKIL